jgi:exodeoxyribonuclease VII large subunit
MTEEAPLPLPDSVQHNVAEFSVGEIARAVKRTLEGTFERVRVRGEISRPNYHCSGHLYFTLKDEEAVIDGVCWRGTVGRLSIRLEEGMEVIATGRVSSYPRSSKYQLVVESIELAGQGALLKLLEDRRKKLAAEGLFDEARKQPLPFLPDIIGVITSPTGAVIRDILHRVADRFPRRVILWPVPVQGEAAPEKIAAAIDGFNRQQPGGEVPRPDLLIVARGGGSLEDLWAFNEEIVVRAAAASEIPLISAIGHETDTTLIDFASDRRAPTPTGAAEMAVPVRDELRARMRESDSRMEGAMERLWEDRRLRIDAAGRGLPMPERLLEEAWQRLDGNAERLARGIETRTQSAAEKVVSLGSRLRHPRAVMEAAGDRLEQLGARLGVAGKSVLRDSTGRLDGLDAAARLGAGIARVINEAQARLAAEGKLLDSVSYRKVLERGFALVRDAAGQPVLRAADATAGAAIEIEFTDGARAATIDGAASPPVRKTPRAKKPPRRGGGEDPQGSLL